MIFPNGSEEEAIVCCPHCRAQLSIPPDLREGKVAVCPCCGKEFGDLASPESVNPEIVAVPEKSQLVQDGSEFDKYRVERLIGKGGMAEVYLAHHLFIDRQCALKIMNPTVYSMGNTTFAQRFVREARICFALDSPNMIKVFDAGCDGKTGYLFIAMEFVEGPNLLKVLEKHRFSEAELRVLGISMARAIAELDAHGIVHRDIKPANIIQRPDGSFCLMDMGIAKIASEKAGSGFTMTMEDVSMGTPAYCSPEQCRSAHTADVRSDIYSLGATLYHLASGKAPFGGTSAMDIMLNVMDGSVEPLKNRRPDLSDGFVSLVERMMEKEPGKRPQTPRELLDCLRGGTPSSRKKRKSSAKAIAALTVLLALVLGAGIWGMSRKAGIGQPDGPRNPEVASGIEDKATAAETNGAPATVIQPEASPAPAAVIQPEASPAPAAVIQPEASPAPAAAIQPEASPMDVAPQGESQGETAPTPQAAPQKVADAASAGAMEDDSSEPELPPGWEPTSKLDISGLVSGLPKARIPEKSSPMEAYKKTYGEKCQLHFPGGGSRGKSEYDWQEIADSEMVHAVLQHDAWNVFTLLELGLDINGKYGHLDSREKHSLAFFLFRSCRAGYYYGSDHWYSSTWGMGGWGVDLLQERHYESSRWGSPSWKEEFIRMFLFLAENGLDMNAVDDYGSVLVQGQSRRQRQKPNRNVSRGASELDVMAGLLQLCGENDDICLWRLIPYAVAQGAKLKKSHEKMIASNSKLSAYVKRVKAHRKELQRPVCTVEMRGDAKGTVGLSAKKYADNAIRAFKEKCTDGMISIWYNCNSGTSLYSGEKKFTPKVFTVEEIGQYFEDGVHPNAIVFTEACFSLQSHLSDGLLKCFGDRNPMVIAFLLKHGSRYGMQRYFARCADARTLQMLWEHGAFVTPSELNSCLKNRKKHNFLYRLYAKQKYHYGVKEVIRLGEEHDKYFKACEALSTHDYERLRAVVGTMKDIDSSCSLPGALSLLRQAVGSDDMEAVKLLLECGASQKADEGLFEYAVKHMSLKSVKHFWPTGKGHGKSLEGKGHTVLCDIVSLFTQQRDSVHRAPRENLYYGGIRDSGYVSVSFTKESYIGMLDYLVDTVGFKLHADCDKCASNETLVHYALFSKSETQYVWKPIYTDLRMAVIDWLVKHNAGPTRSEVKEAGNQERQNPAGGDGRFLAYLDSLRKRLPK